MASMCRAAASEAPPRMDAEDGRGQGQQGGQVRRSPQDIMRALIEPKGARHSL